MTDSLDHLIRLRREAEADRDAWREKAKQLHLVLGALTDAECDNAGPEHFCFRHEALAPYPHVRARELLGLKP